MLKGRYTALVISVFAHLLLLIALVFFSVKQQKLPKEIIKKPAIKSYLYRKPKPVIETLPRKPLAEEQIKVLAKEVKAIAPIKKIEEKAIEVVKIAPVVNNELPTKSNKTSKDDTVQEKSAAPALPTSLPVRPAIRSSSLSSHQSLSRLRNSINQQVANDFSSEQTQVRSASVMHAAQIPVPHSTVSLNAEKRQQQNINAFNTGRIIKHENGRCTIRTEQFLGSPIKATEVNFSCEENPFNKSFREHMAKVNKKFVHYTK